MLPVVDEQFCFTNYKCLRDVASVWQHDPCWDFEVYEWSICDFTGVTYDTPDTPIPVSSINMLIFKHQDIDSHECLGLEDLMLHRAPIEPSAATSSCLSQDRTGLMDEAKLFKRKRDVEVMQESTRKPKRTQREAVDVLDWTYL